MSVHNIVVIGASAGGVEALTQLVKVLPINLQAALFVVVHFPPGGVSVLPQILNRVGHLPAHHARDGEAIQLGHIYVAPPNFHLFVRPHQVRLNRGPRENGHRPAIDTLFRSAAQSYGLRVVGVILTGMLDDGTAGLAVVKARGGIAIVQDPEEAMFDSMPRSAIANVAVDQVLKLNEIAACLSQLSHNPIQGVEFMSDEIEREAEIVAQNKAAMERGERPGNASPLTCPDCGGVLWELEDGNLIRFRCHVGHAYSIESLLAEQATGVEQALWTAVRALEEKAALARRMAAQASQQQRLHSESRFQQQAEEIHQQASLIRQVILQQTHLKNSNKLDSSTGNGDSTIRSSS